MFALSSTPKVVCNGKLFLCLPATFIGWYISDSSHYHSVSSGTGHYLHGVCGGGGGLENGRREGNKLRFTHTKRGVENVLAMLKGDTNGCEVLLMQKT